MSLQVDELFRFLDQICGLMEKSQNITYLLGYNLESSLWVNGKKSKYHIFNY